MQDDNAIGLLQILCRNNCIEKLSLGFNLITDAAMGAAYCLLTVNASLISLGLHSNQITDNGVKVLAKALKKNETLKCFNLSHNSGITDIGVEELCEALKYNHSLETFDLVGVAVTEISCSYFKDTFQTNTSLQTLTLGSRSLSNDVLTLQLTFEDRNISTDLYPVDN